MNNIETPEWDKMIAIKQQWLAIEQFVETINGSEAYIAEYMPVYSSSLGPSSREKTLSPLDEEQVALLIAEHFSIDLEKVKQEQATVIEAFEKSRGLRDSE